MNTIFKLIDPVGFVAFQKSRIYPYGVNYKPWPREYLWVNYVFVKEGKIYVLRNSYWQNTGL